jgi:hypothetical protein
MSLPIKSYPPCCGYTDHPPHKMQFMKCCRCQHEWYDCPGAWGVFYKDGCPSCRHRYWRATAIDAALAAEQRGS